MPSARRAKSTKDPESQVRWAHERVCANESCTCEAEWLYTGFCGAYCAAASRNQAGSGSCDCGHPLCRTKKDSVCAG